MNFKAILFDLDGVLIDSFDPWLKAFNDTLKKFGKKPVDEEVFKKEYWGSELYDNLKALEIGEGTEFCISRFKSHFSQENVHSEADSILRKINSKIGLVTSSPSQIALEILKIANLRDYFDEIICSDDVKRPKPDPEPIKKACKTLGVRANEAVFIGDTEEDLEACREAGVKMIGIDVDADREIKDLNQLLDVLPKQLLDST